ncbi:DMT family transporter [Stutzerimonas stutzeri]|uniref:DMT family transporter n=1 Tax=Stutzerimonas stutzeri TaxID=316 RepID=UPI000F7949E1|nr:DMT family transporter [Stutzerimonas stutzeri]RRV82242.1 DMT family transporter [Stutzerimonas stutzeri]RRV91525.1 DMT family transporter [Stutzerimonas stutzeri]RRV92907.1 DMT family transporter [Stutzerimonas stutzeri]RRV96534.1 DMT family transporter [Stutzerimonas stutzeri]
MTTRTLLLTALAMLAFAGNSILCRIALRDTAIDPASFTGLRIVAGALTLWLLLRVDRADQPLGGDWVGAMALFVYAACFSFAYIDLDAGAGALLLFGAVQLSMAAWGLLRGERFSAGQLAGLLLAVSGLVILLLPGSSTPRLDGALLMILSGIAWGVYSLRGRGAATPLAATAGNFLRAVPLAAVLCLLSLGQQTWDWPGVAYALLSGALTSGVGYAIWYAALPGLAAIQAASVQLSVPLLAAIAGAVLLGEAMTTTLLLAGTAILGGIALVLRIRHRH